MGPTNGIDCYFPYINLVKGTIDNWSQNFQDANGEVHQLPPGRTIAMNVWFALNPHQKIKHGKYVVKWKGGAATLTITCAGAKIDAQVGRRRTCSIEPVTEQTSGSFNIAFTNDTVAPIDIQQLVVCHASHEALLDAGEIFNPDYLDACGTRVAYLRTVKPMGIENSMVTEPSQLRSEANQSWCASGDLTRGGMPYTVAAKLAAKLGCNLHAPVPIRGTHALYDEIARQLASVREFTGIIDAEVGNENWNIGYNARNWLKLEYGASLKPPLPSGRAEAEKALMWFKALSRYFPRARIRRMFCGQLGDGFWRGSYFDKAMQHIDSTGLIQKDASFYTLIDEVRVAPYAHVATSAKPDESGVLHNHQLKNLDWRHLTDGQLDTLFDNGTKIVEGMLQQLVAYLDKLRPGLARSTYEWGQESIASTTGFVGTFYIATISTADNTLVWDVSTPASYTDGDEWIFFTSPNPFPSKSYKQGSRVFIKRKDSRRAWFFATDAARLADTRNAGAGSIVLDADNPGLQRAADNYTSTVQFGARVQAYLDGPSGTAMYQRFFAATIGPGKLREACHFYDFGGYGQGWYTTMWGLKASVYSPDTPRYLWWRSL
ncbi:MAG: hypothetical protein ABI781_16535 [Burkholderiales bacterium]